MNIFTLIKLRNAAYGISNLMSNLSGRTAGVMNDIFKFADTENSREFHSAMQTLDLCINSDLNSIYLYGLITGVLCAILIMQTAIHACNRRKRNCVDCCIHTWDLKRE